MLEKLKLLENNIAELESFRKRYSLKNIQSEEPQEWALRYGLFESIQITIDIACHLVSKYNLGTPGTYSECIELLQQFDYLDLNLSQKLTSMIGLRNLPVHEYIKIDLEQLYNMLKSSSDFKAFAKSVDEYL